ncbi:unnamed protein product [Rotaria socialis]|uniref:Uncharacterized protein n=1 Tax=Rotaria socialis TaxID=392032 RepID=A0A821DN52_9BILA|nr:unnamed protein product [Rotaria socialis]
MERGDWILLDNVNCARGDVIERLNSLAEAEPTLTLYESATSQQYSRGNGIHSDFRLFVIANNNRKMANKLSSAWRNRCLIIRMQPLDDELTVHNVDQHDLSEIVKGELQGINGGQELTHTLLRLHASAKELSNTKDLQFITSYQLSYQNIKRSARILRTYAMNERDPVFALKPSIFRSYLDPILNPSGKISLIKSFIQHLSNAELNKTTYTTLPMLSSVVGIENRHQQMAWYRSAENLHDLIASIEECTLDLHLRVINQYINEEACLKEDFIDYGLFLLDYLQPLLKSKEETISDDLFSQVSTIRSRVLLNDALQSMVLGADLKKLLLKIHQYLLSTRILLSLDNTEDSLHLLDITVQECYKQIINFVEQTSFIDAPYRLSELQRLNNTIQKLSSLSKKLQIICKLSRSSIIAHWSVMIQNDLDKLLITETYMKWVSFPCQQMAKKDLHILLQTQEFIRQQNQTNVDDDDNDFHAALKLINVHLQKVQSIPIVSSADQRLDIILKLCQYLSIMKEDQFILLAASKLELNVACKFSMNLMIKSDFIEKMDEQQTLLSSSNLLASLNSLYFIHTILNVIYEEVASCKVQLDDIQSRYRSQEHMLVKNIEDVKRRITEIHLKIDSLLESVSDKTSNIDVELDTVQQEENTLNDTKARHDTALKNIEQLNENIRTLFLPLRQELKKFEANGWLQIIHDYGCRRQENIINELLCTISKIYLKEYESSQTYSSSNILDEERKQLKSDVLRQHVFKKVNFDEINTAHGRASLTLMQLIYPELFEQNILLFVFRDDNAHLTINNCLETTNAIDIIVNVRLTNFILIDKRSYNRYLTNESGIAYFSQKISFRYFAIEHQMDSNTVDKNFVQLIDRFTNEIKQRSTDTDIDIERKFITVNIDNDLAYFILPYALQHIFHNSDINDDFNSMIEPTYLQQLDLDVQNWIQKQVQLGTIRNEQHTYQNLVENEIHADIEFLLKIVDQVKTIANQTLPSAPINISQLAKLVNETRQDLGRQVITKLERKLEDTLEMCIPKEPIAKARTLNIVERKQFQYPVLNQLKRFLVDPHTRFHVFISTLIDRLHMIQAKLLQIILRYRTNTNEIDFYKKSHQISKLLINIMKYTMDSVDTYGIKISVETYYETMKLYNDDILKHVAYSQFKTVEQLTTNEIDDFKLITKAELDNIIQNTNIPEVVRPTESSSFQPPTTIIKRNAEETMLDRQNEELTKVEKELEQLRQLAKQNGLSRIQYAIVMLLMELHEIKRNKTILNELGLLHWRKSPKQLQRQITAESIERKKSDIFNIKRFKHEKSIDVTPDMLEKTIRYASDTTYDFSDNERNRLVTLVQSLMEEKFSGKDEALEFLTDYFQQQTYESMWTNVEKLIYDLCSSNAGHLTVQSIIDNLKSLMAIFIFLDSTSLAETCRELLQFCQEHAKGEEDRFNLPELRLKELQTKTLENIIQQRSNQLKRLNPCDKSKLLLITSADQDIQTYELIHIYPLLVRLYERREALMRILHDQANYNQSAGMQLSYLRLSDIIALLFPELPVLFMETLQLDDFTFKYIEKLKKYLASPEFRTTIKDLHVERFTLRNGKDESLSLLSFDSSQATNKLVEFMRSLINKMNESVEIEDLKNHWFYQLTESNEYHSFFALEIQSLLSKLFDEMQDNLSQFTKQLGVSDSCTATNYLKFSSSIVQATGRDFQQCKARKATIEKELMSPTLLDYKRRELERENSKINDEYITLEKDYQKILNGVAVERIRRLLEVNRQLQVKGNYLPSQLIEKLDKPKSEANSNQQQQQKLTTSSEFYATLFSAKASLLKMNLTEFNQLKSRVTEFIEKLRNELAKSYDEYHEALKWLMPDDNLYQIFTRFLLAYKLAHTQLLNSFENWLNDMIHQRNSFVNEIEKTIHETRAYLNETLDIVQPIIKAPQVSLITMDMNTVHQTVEELSRIAFHIEKSSNETRVSYRSKVLSILLYHCSSFYARMAIFLVQLFKIQQSNPLVFTQLKTMPIKFDKQSFEWDNNMKRLVILSGFRERLDIPGTSLPVDEYSLREVHQRLCHDFPLLEYSLKLQYTHAFGNICYDPAALMDDIERKMKVLSQIGDWNESVSKTNPLIQVSYNLNVLVSNTQYLLMKILENNADKFELETVKAIAPFLENLVKSIHLSCSSSFETMYSEFLEYILKDQLDLLLDQGLMSINILHNERKKLIESLSHIRSVIENFVDQFILFFIQLVQQHQQKEIDSLQKKYSASIKSRLQRDNIYLLETVSKANLMRYFHYDEKLDEEFDWYNQLTQFLIQGWSQASRFLRTFTSATTSNQQSTAKRLRYSFAFKLLNEEGQRIIVFLQQTIGELERKYPQKELINDEPVIVYLVRLTKLLRYELMRMSMMNLNQLKIDLNNMDRLTLRPSLTQVQSTIDDWNKEIDALLQQRKRIRERWVQRMNDEFDSKTQHIRQKNERLKQEYDLNRDRVCKTIEKTKSDSIKILHDIKLIGKLLQTAKFKSNHFDIIDEDILTNDCVKLVRLLMKAQQKVPVPCQLDREKEGKELMNMINIDSVRIEIKCVEYLYEKPEHKQPRRNMWDNKIQLFTKEPDTLISESAIKPLKSLVISNYVEDIFTDIILDPIHCKKTWYLKILAGNGDTGSWTEMGIIQLQDVDICSLEDIDVYYKFGKYKDNTIKIRITPNTSIQLCDIVIQEGTVKKDESITSTLDESTADPITTDESITLADTLVDHAYFDLLEKYRELNAKDRKKQLKNWIEDLNRLCKNIEKTKVSDCEMPRSPSYYSIPKQESIATMPTIALEKDMQLLKISSPPTHHLLMTQLTLKYEYLERTIVRTVNTLNAMVDENELNRIQHGIFLGFDSADTLKRELQIFKETFHFEKLATTLSKLHDASLAIEKDLQSNIEFRQALDKSLETFQRSGVLVELSKNDEIVSKESINKINTIRMRLLLRDGSALAQRELNFGLEIYHILICIELNLIQLIVHPLETKEHCEKAISLLDTIKNHLIRKQQQTLMNEKQLTTFQVIIDETLVLIHERKKQMRSITQPPRLNNINEISKKVNVTTLMKSTGSPSTSKITINKQNGDYFGSHSSIVIQLGQIIQNWSYAQLHTKSIQIVNNSDDEINFEMSSNSDKHTQSAFVIRSSSSVVDPHDSSTIKITPNSQCIEGKYQERWQLKLGNDRLIISVILCCEIKSFSIDIDLPLFEVAVDDQSLNQLKTYLIDFGLALTCSGKYEKRAFTLQNPTALDLRVKIRREGGAIGKFEIDSKYSTFILLAYESKILNIDWCIQDIVQDAKCVYEIYFSKDFKVRIICLGKSRRISFDLIYRSIPLTERKFSIDLESCIPGTTLYEELTVRNTGEVKMVVESKPENSSKLVVTRLSHGQVLIEPGASLILKIELQIKDAHRIIDNLIDFLFPNASQRPSFKLILKTTSGWPEFDKFHFGSLTKLQVSEEANETAGQLILQNKGPVKMLIDDIHTTSTHVTINNHVLLPFIILPQQTIECHYIYTVQKKSASFDCEFVLKTNCKEPIHRIPFHCKRMAAIISFDQNILHCGTRAPESKILPFSITVKNDGNVSAKLEYETEENSIFSFKFANNEKNFIISPLHPKKIACNVEIKKTAPIGNFKIDQRLVARSSEKTIKKYKLIITGRIEPKDKSTDKIKPIDLPSPLKHLSQSEIEKRLMQLLEDTTNLYRQRAATAIAPVIILIDGLVHSDPKRSDTPEDLTCDLIVSAIESDSHQVATYTNNIHEKIQYTFGKLTTVEWRLMYEKMDAILNGHLPQAIIGVEGMTQTENLSLAVNCAEKLSILFEQHGKTEHEQILARLIEYEKNNHKDPSKEHLANKRLLDYASDLVMNQEEAQKLSNSDKQQLRNLMEKVVSTVETVEKTKNPEKALSTLISEMTTETNRDPLKFLDRLLELSSNGESINEQVILQKMFESNIPLTECQLVTQAIATSDNTLSVSTVFDYVQEQLDDKNESKNIVEFMKLSERISNEEFEPSLNDVSAFPGILASLSPGLSSTEKNTLQGLQSIISNLTDGIRRADKAGRDWKMFIDDICTILQAHIDQTTIDSLRTVLTITLLSDQTSACDNQISTNIVSSMLNFGNDRCRLLSCDLKKLMEPKDSFNLLESVLSLTCNCRQLKSKQIAWMEILQKHFAGFQSGPITPDSITSFVKTAKESFIDELKLPDHRKLNNHLVSIVDSIQNKRIIPLMQTISDICDLMNPIDKEQKVNDELIRVISHVTSTTMTQLEVLEQGIKLASQLNDSDIGLKPIEHLNTLLESYKNLMPAMNGEFTQANISNFIDQTIECIPDEHMKQFLKPISNALDSLSNNKNPTMIVIDEVLFSNQFQMHWTV